MFGYGAVYDALPDTLDFEGPGSAAYLTLAGARYTWKVGANANLSVAAAAPSAPEVVVACHPAW